MIDVLAMLLMTAGAAFFLAGTVGLLRLPDVYTRLHALTKADNLGLGLLVAGLILDEGLTLVSAKLALIWLLVAVGSGLGAHLIADSARSQKLAPWRRP